MKRQLCKDVTLQQKEVFELDGTYRYILEVKNDSYYQVLLVFDFADSKKIRFSVGEDEEARNPNFSEVVFPFEAKRVVSLTGTTGWVITYSLEYSLQFPEKYIIQGRVEAHKDEIEKRIKHCIKKPSELSYKEFIDGLIVKEMHFIDNEFLPIDVFGA